MAVDDEYPTYCENCGEPIYTDDPDSFIQNYGMILCADTAACKARARGVPVADSIEEE